MKKIEGFFSDEQRFIAWDKELIDYCTVKECKLTEDYIIQLVLCCRCGEKHWIYTAVYCALVVDVNGKNILKILWINCVVMYAVIMLIGKRNHLPT